MIFIVISSTKSNCWLTWPSQRHLLLTHKPLPQVKSSCQLKTAYFTVRNSDQNPSQLIFLAPSKKALEAKHFKISVKFFLHKCSARDWDGKDYLRIIPRVVW
jgi:hypothetical protein